MGEHRWEPGDLIVERHVFRGAVHWAAPMWVVEDRGDFVAAYLPIGTIYERPADESGAPTRNFVSATQRVSQAWRDHHVLHLTRSPDHYNVELFWTEDWRFRCWYVNFQQPVRRYEHSLETMDQTLDLVIAPDRKSHSWKDEDEFQWGIDAGWYTVEQLQRLKAIGAGVLDDARSGRWPFDAGWENWRPDPAWGTPVFPDGWDYLR